MRNIGHLAFYNPTCEHVPYKRPRWPTRESNMSNPVKPVEAVESCALNLSVHLNLKYVFLCFSSCNNDNLRLFYFCDRTWGTKVRMLSDFEPAGVVWNGRGFAGVVLLGNVLRPVVPAKSVDHVMSSSDMKRTLRVFQPLGLDNFSFTENLSGSPISASNTPKRIAYRKGWPLPPLAGANRAVLLGYLGSFSSWAPARPYLDLRETESGWWVPKKSGP